MEPVPNSELQAAYGFCREVARREAKNFYWAFRALPRHKSDAMCAVYAFMRRADDLADDESLSLDARREAMAEWTAAWQRSQAEGTTDPVFLAVNDVQARFGVPHGLLEQLVAGTTMDLQPQVDGTVQITDASGRGFVGYRDFDALYRYCYLVASVVGLVTIRIFGYTDRRAEQLAEHTGVAFQLTNILRDVREDAERGRVYLPQEELTKANVPLERLLAATRGGPADARLMALLRREIARAEEFYASGVALLPMIERDARPAMSVLIAIYHRLLQRIAKDPRAVLRSRVSVPTATKLAILARGVTMSTIARLR